MYKEKSLSVSIHLFQQGSKGEGYWPDKHFFHTHTLWMYIHYNRCVKQLLDICVHVPTSMNGIITFSEAAPPAVKPLCVTPHVSFTFPFKCGLCECHACCGQHVNMQQTKHAALCSVVRITERHQLFQVLFFCLSKLLPKRSIFNLDPSKMESYPAMTHLCLVLCILQ